MESKLEGENQSPSYHIAFNPFIYIKPEPSHRVLAATEACLRFGVNSKGKNGLKD